MAWALGTFPDRALYSPDLSSYPTSPQSSFMYEHDDGLERGHKICENIFESPKLAPAEDNDLGGELDFSFWNETTSMLATSFGDGVKPSLWDFSGFDDISSPLQHPEDDLSYCPTLAELNADDFQEGARTVPKTKSWMHLGSNGVTSSNPIKTQSSVAGPSAADVTTRQNSASVIQDPTTSLDSPSVRSHSAHLSTKLGAHPSKEKRVKSVERLTFKTQPQFHQHRHHSGKLSKKSRDHLEIGSGAFEVKMVRQDVGSIKQKWKVVNGRSNTLHEEKAVFIKDDLTPPRGYSSGGTDGYDSHDEGLGSEHEDQDDEDSDDIEDEDEELSDAERDADAHSDMSEDHGVATTSAAAPDMFPQKFKSRRSEYDDLIPNPKRLLSIANELHKLNQVISGMVPVSALPVSARNRSRKEKNKLASRACRLKKKAQHETNKLKLYGLDKEHDRLMQVIAAIKRELLIYLDQQPQKSPRLSEKLEALIKDQMVANHTQEYVNGVLEKTANSSKLTGGLSFLKSHE